MKAEKVLREFKERVDSGRYSPKENLEFLIRAVGREPSQDPKERARQAIFAYNELLEKGAKSS